MKIKYIIFGLLVVLVTQYSCVKTTVLDAGFKDQLRYSIYDYLVANQDQYSSFLEILKAGGLDKTLSAYNPGGKTGGVGYTLFLPTNIAVDDFIKASNGQYGSLADLLNDKTMAEALARYHILNQSVITNDFPFGSFSQPNMSNDYLNVNFDVRPDTTFYKINNEAKVIKANIEMSNGYIQVIGSMLTPIVFNSYGWLKKHPAYSIFTSAVEATGIDKIINVNMKSADQTLRPFTMLVEPDSIYKKRNINSLADLENLISPGRTDYTQSENPLNKFVGYHLLTGSYFLSDIVRVKFPTNYNTFSDIPININGAGVDIVINKYKEIFKSSPKDSTDYVGLYYDASNVNTQSGPIHFVNQILKPQVPTAADVWFNFGEEKLLRQYAVLGGTYLIEDHSLLSNITWSGAGAKLTYVKSSDPVEYSNNKDYLQIEGDFTITYTIPKLIPGKYDVFLDANHLAPQNATVEMFIDGNKIGGLIDLTTGANNINNPYWPSIKVGTIDLIGYASHAVQFRALIPGRFIWDQISFQTIKINK